MIMSERRDLINLCPLSRAVRNSRGGPETRKARVIHSLSVTRFSLVYSLVCPSTSSV